MSNLAPRPTGSAAATSTPVASAVGPIKNLRLAHLGALAFVGIVALIVFFPSVIAPGDPLAVNPAEAFASPSAHHWMGTDESGRDIFSRVIHGARDSLKIGIFATGLGMSVALVLGTTAALAPRLIDAAILRLLEALYAIPTLLFALLIMTFTGRGAGPAIIAVGLSVAPGYARMVRSQVLTLRGAEMTEAAIVLGHAPMRIARNHLIPHAVRALLALITLGVGQAIIWASGLAFLGLGTPPPAPEWGAMLASGRTYLHFAWWMTVFPGLAIVAVASITTALGRALGGRGHVA